MHVTCYDLKKADDKIPRATLWTVLQQIGVPPRMLKCIQQLHDGMEARVVVEGELTESTLQPAGLQGGD